MKAIVPSIDVLRSTDFLAIQLSKGWMATEHYHPLEIREAVAKLRSVHPKFEFITLNPLVLNELGSDEIEIWTLDSEKNVVKTLLWDTPNYNERSSVYANGELWLSYLPETSLLAKAE